MLDLWGQASVDILCTHPMFGPESGRYSWRGLPFVYEKVRVADVARCEEFLRIFASAGCRMIEMSCEEHDAKAANSQFVTHFTGRSLAELQLKVRRLAPARVANPRGAWQATGIDTRGFASLLELVENTVKDSDDLFFALYRHNPSAVATLDKLGLAVVGCAAGEGG
jgi:arogenate dehydrogenase (NADP+)